MLLEAASDAASNVDIIFFADQGIIERNGPAVAQASLKRDWGISANVRLIPRATMSSRPIFQTAKGLFNFRAQDNYLRTHGRIQYDMVRAHLCADTDLIVAHRLYIGSTIIGARVGDVPIVMDLDDIEHRKLGRVVFLARPRWNSYVAKLELRALKRGELATIRKCRTSFVCSRIDSEYLASEGLSNITIVPNAIRFSKKPVRVATVHAQTLFFIGTYGYLPNAHAAEYLIRTIYPLVRQRRPAARLLIVGNAVETLPSFDDRPRGVDFVGFVPDLAEVYRRATVVCCPILSGGGTRIKIIEAAAARKAIVSTTIGAEGLDLVDEREILLRDSPATFADACIALLDDPSRADALGSAAYDKARQLYDRRNVVAHIARSYREHSRNEDPASFGAT